MQSKGTIPYNNNVEETIVRWRAEVRTYNVTPRRCDTTKLHNAQLRTWHI